MSRMKWWIACGVAVAAGAARGAEPGRVQEWLLAGSFPNPQPETLLAKDDLADPVSLAPSPGDKIGEAKWFAHAAPTGAVNLLDKEVGVPRTRNAGAVAMVYVYSPKVRPAKLLLGFSDGLAAYLNGAKVFQMPDGGGSTADAHRADVLLGEGWNRLYLKVIWYGRLRGEWNFTARLLGEDLKPMEDLKFSAANPFPGGKSVMPKYAAFVSAYHVEHFGTHRIRLVNRTPLEVEDVRLVVRSREGKELMKADLGKLAAGAHVEADVEADEVFFQQHYRGATAEIRHKGGILTAPIGELVLPGTHTIEYATPHLQRMQPWAAGRCRILLIAPETTRQSVELAERGDLEWHIVDVQGEKGDQKVAEEIALYKFDAVVIADKSGGREPWTWEQVPGRTHLAKAIREGVGIVYVNPGGLGAAMEKVLGIAPAGAAQGSPARAGKLEKAADHPILSGLPVDALPPVAPYPYRFAEGTQVLLKASGQPVLAAAERDGQRIVVLNLGRGNELIWRIPREDFCEPRLPAWERQWSLILKCIIWAAKRETGLTVSCSVPDGLARDALEASKITVSLAGGEKAAKCRLTVKFRSRGLDGPEVRTEELTVPAGQKQDVQMRIPAHLDAGANEVDVTVAGDDGKVLGWASGVFQVAPRGSIEKISVAPVKECYLPADELTFSVSGKAAGGLLLWGRLVDNRGRVVAEEKRQPSGAFEETFKFKCEGLLSPVGRFQAVLIAPSPKATAPSWEEARREQVFFVRRELVWDTYEPVLWLTRNDPQWYYDIDYFKLLREVMWIPNGWSGDFNPAGSAYWQMVYGGFDSVGMESLHFFSMNHNWNEKTFEHRRRQFARTKDLAWLYRTPIVGDKPTATIDYSSVPLTNDPYNTYFPLDDPDYHAWTGRKIARQMQGVRRFNPIIYDLMDEASYTTYARAFDFDYSPISLKHFRVWLKEQYGTLEALNGEWETDFKTWDDVVPMPVEQARARARTAKLPNYAPWVDHRRYGDLVYNRYVKLTGDLARRDDADACVGIGGGQRANPYGGWDYWLVANHFTWIENYFEETDEYIRSFNTPDRRLKPCPGKDVWKSVSHGNMGFYRWVDTGHVQGDLSLLPRGATTARQLQEVRGGGLGKLFLGAEAVDDPIAIHYSQSTVHLAYALGSADDLGNGGCLNAKLGFYNLLEELGYQFKFVSYEQVADGHLEKAGYKLMILPESMSLSNKEAGALKKFVEAGGVLLCDRMVGEFDEHGRRRGKSVLEEYFGMDPAQAGEKKIGKGLVIYLNDDLPVEYWGDRASKDVRKYWTAMKEVLKKAGLEKARAEVLSGSVPARRTEVRYFRLGKIAYHVLRAEVAAEYEFVAAGGGHVYDMRSGRYDGDDGRIAVRSEEEFPALVALSPYRIESVSVKAQAPGRAGEKVEVSAAVQASAAPGTHALNFRVYSPDGVERRHYGQTLLAPEGKATLTFQSALNDPRGQWTVRVTDLASGAKGEATFEIK